MTRSDHLTALLAKYRITPCGSHSCIFGNPANHVGPNGPCQCHEELFGDGRTMRLDGFRREVMRLAAIIRELDQRVPATAEQFVERVAGDCKATEQETAEQIAAWLEREAAVVEAHHTAVAHMNGADAARYVLLATAAAARAGRWKELG